jgi:pimeloyl-ACP methyl ester carboxylesterase
VLAGLALAIPVGLVVTRIVGSPLLLTVVVTFVRRPDELHHDRDSSSSRRHDRGQPVHGFWACAGWVAAGVGGSPSPRARSLIEVGGWRLHLNCTGEVRAGQPIVVLEAGVGAFSVEWSLVQPGVAALGRVCSCDRAGSGWSEWGPDPRTMQQIVYELHTLLARAEEQPPYVLVGASYGGWLVRWYHLSYPKEVAGVVLVDAGASDPLRLTPDGREVPSSTLATGRQIPPIKTSGPLRENQIPPAALEQIRAGLGGASARANEPPRDRLPPEARAIRTWGLGQVGHVIAAVNPFEADELAELRRRTAEHPQPFGDTPVIVITRGRTDGDGPTAAAREEAHRADHAAIAALSRRGRQVIAELSGHHVQLEDPALVIRLIEEILVATRR